MIFVCWPDGFRRQTSEMNACSLHASPCAVTHGSQLSRWHRETLGWKSAAVTWARSIGSLLLFIVRPGNMLLTECGSVLVWDQRDLLLDQTGVLTLRHVVRDEWYNVNELLNLRETYERKVSEQMSWFQFADRILCDYNGKCWNIWNVSA